MNFSEYYKKAWENSLSERTTELIAEIKTLRAQNARYREALGYYANGRELTNRAGADDATLEWVSDEMDISKIDGKWVLGHHAREALKGEK